MRILNNGRIDSHGQHIVGNNNRIYGDTCTVTGNNNRIYGRNGNVTGNNNRLYGTNGNVTGNNNRLYGHGCTEFGLNNRRYDGGNADPSSASSVFPGFGGDTLVVDRVSNFTVGRGDISGGQNFVNMGTGPNAFKVLGIETGWTIGTVRGSFSQNCIKVTEDRRIFYRGKELDYRIEGTEIEWSFVKELAEGFRAEAERNGTVFDDNDDTIVTGSGRTIFNNSGNVYGGSLVRITGDYTAARTRSSPRSSSAFFSRKRNTSAGDNLHHPYERDFGKDEKAEKDDDLCCVCLDNRKTCAVFPCGHLCLCGACAKDEKKLEGKCPVCRGPARDVRRTYS